MIAKYEFAVEGPVDSPKTVRFWLRPDGGGCIEVMVRDTEGREWVWMFLRPGQPVLLLDGITGKIGIPLTPRGAVKTRKNP